MKTLRLFLFVCFACFAVHLPAADFQITGYVTITNTPAGNTTNLVVNIGTSTTRTFTNNAALAPSTTIQTTNSTASTRTNVLSQLSLYPIYSVGSTGPRLLVTLSSTNTSALEFTAPRNTNITVTFGGNWATVYYVTSTYAAAVPIQNSTNAMSAEARTNAANAIVNLLAATNMVPSNSIPPAAKSLQHYTDNVSAQTVSNKTFTGPVATGGRWNGITNATGTNVAFTNVTLYLVAVTGASDLSGYAGAITNGSFWSNILQRVNISNAVAIGGYAYRLTNGYWTNGTLDSPKLTNAVNYGGALSSPGSGTDAEEFGAGATAGSDYDTAIGADATATNISATAVGRSAAAFAAGTAIGSLGTANTNSVAIGYGARATGYGSTVIGANADDNDYFNIILIGESVSATANNQIVIGGSSQITRFPSPIAPESSITNATWRGTNVLNGRLDLTSRANTGLANGYNSGVIFGTNVYVRFSGPSAAYTNAGFAAPGGPQFVHAQFDNPGLSFTLLDQSGIEATAANRILTGTGALLNSTNNPVMATFLYDDTASRWRILSFR